MSHLGSITGCEPTIASTAAAVKSLDANVLAPAMDRALNLADGAPLNMGARCPGMHSGVLLHEPFTQLTADDIINDEGVKAVVSPLPPSGRGDSEVARATSEKAAS